MRLAICGLLLGVALCGAEPKEIERVKEAASVFDEIMGIKERTIPQELLDRAECVVIVPGLKKAAFIFGAKYGKRVSRLSADALASLSECDWPGNARELRHVIERAVLGSSAEATELDRASLGPLPPSPAPRPGETRAGSGRFPTEGIRLAEWERGMIEQALSEAKGNQTSAARLLGISRDTLRYRMAKFKVVR